jgi:fluoride exporter
MINNFILVAIGGASGAMLRYAFSFVKTTATFPWQTMLVNIIGCFFIGIFITLYKTNKIENTTYLLLATGVCGGFTTFSTFSAESLYLLQNDKFLYFSIYILASVFIGLLATYTGIKTSLFFSKIF